jgi:hypothetical protein
MLTSMTPIWSMELMLHLYTIIKKKRRKIHSQIQACSQKYF